MKNTHGHHHPKHTDHNHPHQLHKIIKIADESVRVTYDRIHASCKYHVGCSTKDCATIHCSEISERIAKTIENTGFKA